MARPLQVQHHTPASSTAMSYSTAAPLLLALAAVVAVVVSLCTSSAHAKKWKQHGKAWHLRPGSPAPEIGGGGSKKLLLASLSGIGSTAASVAKMVSSKRPAAGTDGGEEGNQLSTAEEEALWKKTIMMGEKCRPVDFSGSIAYDSDGNQLPPPATTEAKSSAAAKDMDHGING